MSVVKAQFDELSEQFPNAELKELADGSFLITISNISLPSGWSEDSVIVKFLAPVGYPHAKPDCFWVDPELKIMSIGGNPQAIQMKPLPDVGGNYMWFSWHIKKWNPNRDTLITFTRVILKRFEDVK